MTLKTIPPCAPRLPPFTQGGLFFIVSPLSKGDQGGLPFPKQQKNRPKAVFSIIHILRNPFCRAAVGAAGAEAAGSTRRPTYSFSSSVWARI